MKAFFSDQGIVLRKFNTGEKDQVVRVFTKAFGKRSFMVKGVRSPSSRKCGAIDVGQHIRFSARESKTGMWYMDQVQLETSVRDKANSVSAMGEVFGVVGLMDQLLQDEQVIDGVYSLALSVLSDIGKHDEALAVFQVKLLSLLGFVPSFDRCGVCGERLDLGRAVGSDMEHGGFVCGGHESGPATFGGGALRPVSTVVSGGLVKVLHFWQRSEWGECFRVQLDEELMRGVHEQVSFFLLPLTSSVYGSVS